jgi:hypothetical protein
LVNSSIYIPYNSLAESSDDSDKDFLLYENYDFGIKVEYSTNWQKDSSKDKIDELIIIQSIAKDTELKELLEEITTLERLPYNNMKISEWESRVLKLLEAELGNDSDCYKQFLYQTQHGFWRPGTIDPRMIIVSPEFYQQEYMDQVQGYRDILQRCTENK